MEVVTFADTDLSISSELYDALVDCLGRSVANEIVESSGSSSKVFIVVSNVVSNAWDKLDSGSSLMKGEPPSLDGWVVTKDDCECVVEDKTSFVKSGPMVLEGEVDMAVDAFECTVVLKVVSLGRVV